MEVIMVEIKEGYKYSCCNSCGRVNINDIVIWRVEAGMDDLAGRISLGFCNECLKELHNQMNKFFDCEGRIKS